MRKIFISLIASVLTGLAIPAQAESHFITTVDRFFPTANGTMDISFATSSSACTNTATPKRYKLAVGTVGLTLEGFKNIYAALLYAASVGKSVDVYFDETLSACNITRVAVLDIT